MRRESFDVAVADLTALADEVEHHRTRVTLTRPGHGDVVLLSSDDLESLEETEFWLRDEADRARSGEAPGAGEAAPALTKTNCAFGSLA
jgi:prevent-host-death family protein